MSFTTLQSACKGGFPVTFAQTEYATVAQLPKPFPLILTISRSDSFPIDYTVKVTNTLNQSISFAVTYDDGVRNKPVIYLSGGAPLITCSFTQRSAGPKIDLNMQFNNNPYSLFNPNTYVVGDRYIIHLNLDCGTQITFQRPNRLAVNTLQATTSNVDTTSGLTNLSMRINNDHILSRVNSSVFSNTCCTGATGCTGSAIIPNLIRIPGINILGQTTVNGDFLSDFTFIVDDTRQYYDCNAIILPGRQYTSDCDNCQPIYVNPKKLVTTKFFQYGPNLQCIVKGKGTSLRDKVLYTYDRINLIISFQQFYINIITYAMLKYILARVLYGQFDMKYLARNFNCQFFKDLAHSRFCGFIEFFDDPANGLIGYHKYFKNACD